MPKEAYGHAKRGLLTHKCAVVHRQENGQKIVDAFDKERAQCVSVGEEVSFGV